MDTDAKPMSYLGSDFPHDVFVSYSHGDPLGTGDSPLKHWSRRLVEELKKDVLAVDPELDGLALWFDKDVDPTLRLDEQLREKVSRAALLLILMSPRYLSSTWCGDELGWFEAEVRRRERGDGLVFVVRALPTKESRWPVFLKDSGGNVLVGFPFHPLPASDGAYPYGWPEPTRADREFYMALGGLSTVLRKRLKELKQQLAKGRPPQPVGREGRLLGDRPRLYLHARPEDTASWQSAKEVLGTAGFEVWPEKLALAPRGMAAMLAASRERVRQLSECDALVILQVEAGERIDDELDVTGKQERADLADRFKRNIPCALLDLTGGGSARAGELGIELIDGRHLRWPRYLKVWLDEVIGVGALVS